MNKLNSFQRIEVLTDHGTFEEIGATLDQVKNKNSAVTGSAKINGRLVFIAAIDPAWGGGCLSEAAAKKINRILDMAIQNKAPVVTLFECVGARIQEGVVAMHHIGFMFQRFSNMSGVVPTIAMQFGINSGATAYAAGLMDFVIMVEQQSCSFITGPKVIEKMTGEKSTHEELGGTAVHGRMTGLASFVEPNEGAAIQRAKDLLKYLPQHCFEESKSINLHKRKKNPPAKLLNILPDKSKAGYDMHEIIHAITDDNSFLELYGSFSQNLLCGFARLGDAPIGIAANQPIFLSGILDVDSCKKLFRFVQICDAYNIPLLFIADSPGFMPGIEQEQTSMISIGARLLHILSTSTIPKITLIVNKIIGGAYGGMSSRGLGSDVVYAWPTAQIAVVGSQAALQIIYSKEINASADPEAVIKAKLEEFETKHLTPYTAAEHGQVDAVIHPDDTRKILLKTFFMLSDKAETPVKRRRPIIPM